MNIRLALQAGLALALASAAGAASPTPERQTVALWYQAFSQKEPKLLDRALAPDWVDIPSAPGEPAGPEAAKAFLGRFTQTFPDLTITIEDVVQQGDKVVVRSRIRGTLHRPFLGATPSGQQLDIQAIDIHQLHDGRIARTWHSEDWMSGLRQLGVTGR
jgi:steroid delta-isomerase-like uncharacterized protein